MSSSGVWGPAPAGVDLSENQNANIIASVTVVMALALSAIVLRLIARLSRTGPGLGKDDFVILAAAVLGIGNAACCLLPIQWGAGYHLWVVTVDEFIKLYQTTFAFVIVYIWSVTLTKTSILLFYRRMFGANIVWYIVFTFAILHGLEVTITWLSGCRPISYYWRQYTDPTAEGSCINASLFYLVNGVIGMTIDIMILLVPVPTIYKLRMPREQKVAVYGILLLGSFVCVASIVRIVMIEKLVKAQDFTWAMCQVFVWSCVEPFVGMVCACLPTYAPFVRRWVTRKKGDSLGGKKTPYNFNKPGPGSKGEWSRINGYSTDTKMLVTTPQGLHVKDEQVELMGVSTVSVYSNAQGLNHQHKQATYPNRPVGSDGNAIMVTRDISLAKSDGRRTHDAA